MTAHKDHLALLSACFGKEHLSVQETPYEITLEASPNNISATLGTLRDHKLLAYTQLVDVCGVDYLGHDADKRFQVVYHLLSMSYNRRLRVIVPLADDQPIASATSVFAGADWWEREAYDMFGIPFTGHPDLRRILTDYEFKGWPLRKDFPLTGYVQVRYDPDQAKVVEEPVHLEQAYRSFDTLSPWNGMEHAAFAHTHPPAKDTPK